MIVAEAIFDYLENTPMEREFHYEAMAGWWGWGEGAPISEEELVYAPKVKFRLYDDDDILYFSGWLYNDLDCMVQQFVLDWAKADSGCTTIKVHRKNKGKKEWVQDIG